ncbi:NUDIX domain-containing protein [Chryseomicrobium palamuruense]|uniref:NUDIX domain-containing protein n=1 Tax=Chryseomicrobium palamuruense TaxID=682973 RepID=A0ABV8UYC8_9BACL
MSQRIQEPFYIHLGEPVPDGVPVITRTGVRAIMESGEELLMMKSIRGDYKFPGGGMEAGEDERTALKREVLEETGYVDATIGELAGTVIQSHPDRVQKGAWYCQTSPYYYVSLPTQKQQPIALTEEEIDQGFHAVWIRPEEAIAINETIPLDPNMNFYIERENRVMAEIIKQRTIHVLKEK